MSWLTNTTSTDLEVPSLGVTVPAGHAAEIPDGFEVNNPDLKVTKTKPSGVSTDPWAPVVPEADAPSVPVEPEAAAAADTKVS